MPSWDDEWVTPSLLSDVVDMDFAPPTCDDPSFHGLAVDSSLLCRVHNLKPQKCVAFGGTDTGRRFYMCSVLNDVENCGFVAWLDGQKWPPALKNCLAKVWGMYDDANSARIDEKILHGEMIKQLSDEKKRVEKDYNSLCADVKKFMIDTENRMLQDNYKKIMENNEESLEELKKEVEVLKKEILELKNIQRSQASVMKGKEKTWGEEKDGLKEEKKKLEYMLFDLLKVSESSKDKLKRIKAICEE